MKTKKERLLWVVTCSLVILLSAVTQVAGSEGSVRLSIQGYGTVHGRLQNATIQPNGTVSLLMLVNDQLVTSQGAFPTSASGIWVGTVNGSAISGQIQDVVGVVRICLFTCQDANFVGVGTWNGLLNGTDAAGNFDGTITFENSPVPQIPAGQPIPVSGTWNASFQLAMPEIAPEMWPYLLAFAVAACLLVSTIRRGFHDQRCSRRGINTDRYAFLRKSL